MASAKLILLGAVVGLAGCHGDAAQSPAATVAGGAKAPPTPKKGPSVADQTAGMVEAVSTAKSNVPVDLRFDLLQRPTVGQPLGIDIALVPHIAADAASIQLADADGLKLAPGQADIEFSALEPEVVYRRKISVTPSADGVFYLALTVQLKHDEITEARVFSIPIIAAEK